ncbi:helix-turn-helix domain-containing protein [Brevibacillus laterosporus]|uniref:PucR family transcriptional regulator n=1 Tax=Brevibacillus laterosporus TaxID=1465 RepID=UPI0003749466|nr:helix-turn-helix domain-containing protein [Brevibacillus laterosporus]ATO48961.1 transcriptional regulator [Brevibacillus laterosporus DSM 25]MBG9803276.1 transcriptional regulator [Brevibacillus laterosporus]MED2001864.1 helix-turn-helix domain-containing protein [Brevibacillus laterosporus]MED4765962.1 helix-turn-helix domain-containing protein [Brevibacillus laterosporus]TPH09165.1 PucR family transcriptional regulator [Brevibacillus laterosporus]
MQQKFFDQYQHSDIDELADVIGELLQNPITIEDLNHRLIAYSSHGDSTDQARWSTIMGRRVPEKVLTRLWKDGVFQQLFSQKDPVHIPEKKEIGLGKRVAITIRRGNDILGYIWAQEVNRPLTSWDDEILRQAAKEAVPRLLQRQGKRKAEQDRQKEFLWELLLGGHGEETKLQQKAINLHMKIVPPLLICTIEVLEGKGEQIHQLLYPLLMRDKIYNLTDGPQLILLMQHPKGKAVSEDTLVVYSEQFLEECMSKLTDKFGKGKVHIGCGRPVCSLIEGRQSYQEALQMNAIKRLFPHETERILRFQQLGIYRFLPQMKIWNKEQAYKNDQLAKLLYYDQENQTNLTETLEVFLDHVGKVNRTAAHLHIHINTLSYRLKRIEEIMQIDLDDPNQRYSLYIDLKVMKLE